MTALKRPDPRDDRILRELALLRRKVRDLELRKDLSGGAATPAYEEIGAWIGHTEMIGVGDLSWRSSGTVWNPLYNAVKEQRGATWLTTNLIDAGSGLPYGIRAPEDYTGIFISHFHAKATVEFDAAVSTVYYEISLGGGSHGLSDYFGYDGMDPVMVSKPGDTAQTLWDMQFNFTAMHWAEGPDAPDQGDGDPFKVTVRPRGYVVGGGFAAVNTVYSDGGNVSDLPQLYVAKLA